MFLMPPTGLAFLMTTCATPFVVLSELPPDFAIAKPPIATTIRTATAAQRVPGFIGLPPVWVADAPAGGRRPAYTETAGGPRAGSGAATRRARGTNARMGSASCRRAEARGGVHG